MQHFSKCTLVLEQRLLKDSSVPRSHWLKLRVLMFLLFCPQAIETCVAAAGFSVGEFAALVFSGAMNYAEGEQDMFLSLYMTTMFLR